MPLTQGSVTVADNGTVTKSGIAARFYDADVATMTLATPPTLGATTPPYSTARPASSDDIAAINAANIKAKQEAARRANAHAAAVYLILTVDTHALVTSESLGVLPDPADPGAAIAPPASPVSLPLG
jgi:hypothetical protein